MAIDLLLRIHRKYASSIHVKMKVSGVLLIGLLLYWIFSLTINLKAYIKCSYVKIKRITYIFIKNGKKTLHVLEKLLIYHTEEFTHQIERKTCLLLFIYMCNRRYGVEYTRKKNSHVMDYSFKMLGVYQMYMVGFFLHISMRFSVCFYNGYSKSWLFSEGQSKEDPVSAEAYNTLVEACNAAIYKMSVSAARF